MMDNWLAGWWLMLINPIVTQLYDGKIPIYMIWLVVKKTILKNQVSGKDDIPYIYIYIWNEK